MFLSKVKIECKNVKRLYVCLLDSKDHARHALFPLPIRWSVPLINNRTVIVMYARKLPQVFKSVTDSFH